MKKKLTAVVCSLVLAACMPVTAWAGTWQSGDKGWWYQEEDGTYPAAAWREIDGLWYHFNGEGYMDTGWLLDGASWYYLESSGAMRTEALSENGTVYYFDASGVCANPYGDEAISGEVMDDLTYGLSLLGWYEDVNTAIDALNQWDGLLQNGSYDSLKASILEARAPFESWKNIVPPAKYAAAHNEFALSCEDFLRMFDKVYELTDGIQKNSITQEQADRLMEEMNAALNSAEAHMDRASELYDAIP